MWPRVETLVSGTRKSCNTEKQLKEPGSKLTDAEKKDKETSFRGKIQDYQKRAGV